MSYILFDDKTRENLLPLTFTKPTAELRFGILTIREKWENYLNEKISHLTEDYLKEKYPIQIESDNILINGSVCPSAELNAEISNLQLNEVLISDSTIIACHVDQDGAKLFDAQNTSAYHNITCKSEPLQVSHLWDLFQKNGDAIQQDFEMLSKGRDSASISNSNKVMGDQLFVEEGVSMEHVIINTTTGPVYIGKNTEIMEGCLIRGPFAICNDSTLKLGTKIYGPSTIGPYSKAGGEISNSIIMGYSNKAHDGFMGNSLLGEWCNLGADTNTSNLKNNYGRVKIWSYISNSYESTDLQFCGLIMGDHSKCGINTMFNTGTVIGVSANIFGAGFPPKHIPSFSWGGAAKIETFDFNKAIELTKVVTKRRNIDFADIDERILREIYNRTVQDH